MSQTLETPTSTLLRLSDQVIAQLRSVSILASLSDERLHCLDGADTLHFEPGEVILRQGEVDRVFYILLEGSVRFTYLAPSGAEETVYQAAKGIAFGEVPLLANIPSTSTIRALESCDFLILDEEQFWRLMTECPEVRKSILGNMAFRLSKIQSNTFQQEKMAALGTLAAGLMHELNNPGSAARRASSQLRENLLRLHELASRFTRLDLSQEQKDCVLDLQHYALNTRPTSNLSSLEQTDAEEALADWMDAAHIADAWKLAPTLVATGIDQGALTCARDTFKPEVFSDALNWLEALASSMQLVGTIEESISRVTDLIGAVKTYAYEGKGQKQSIDLNKSIHATIVIMLHKIREKQLTLAKDFGANLPLLSSACQGINQVWTNLLDNAIDAAPQSSQIKIRTWAETTPADPSPSAPSTSSQPRTELCILIEDNGPGIPTECQSQIFDPFFTTKPVGVGTGLGLGIVYRIVEQCGGSIHFSSVPGSTEFVVRLPAA